MHIYSIIRIAENPPGPINRPLLCMDELVNLHNWVHTFVCYTPRLARLEVVFFVDDARADVFLPVDA